MARVRQVCVWCQEDAIRLPRAGLWPSWYDVGADLAIATQNWYCDIPKSPVQQGAMAVPKGPADDLEDTMSDQTIMATGAGGFIVFHIVRQ